MQGGARRLGPNTPSIVSQHRDREPEELKFTRAAEGVCVRRRCQNLQQFVFGSAGGFTISPIQVCQVSWIVVGLDNVSDGASEIQ